MIILSKKLQDRLITFKYFSNLFGFEDFDNIKQSLSSVAETQNEYGNSNFYDVIKSNEKCKVPLEKLKKYDQNILEYVEHINLRRVTKINLKYYQYLSVLYTEYYLDYLFNDLEGLLMKLNQFKELENSTLPGRSTKYNDYTASSLKKLAFWSATGSGKTILMHINYLQYLKYCDEEIDNVILVTPNKGLSLQHDQDFNQSNIESVVYSDVGPISLNFKDTIKIIEITKLTLDKKGQGQSIDVSSFEGHNLVFVDEGHKGTGGDSWTEIRKTLSKKGFTFEYSATFGQSINSVSNNKELLQEYSKAIIFDYSYKYFHRDGFGKDYYILNIDNKDNDSFQDEIFLGNLLSFYEQKLYYLENKIKLNDYQIEQPLWIFIGHSVSGRKNLTVDDERSSSDVLQVLNFLNRFVQNEGNNMVKMIEDIIKDRGTLKYNGKYIFKDNFQYLKEKKYNSLDLYYQILNSIFKSNTAGTIELFEIKNAEGEIGLKLKSSSYYFGLINIGDVTNFKKLIKDHGISIYTDNFNSSIFNNINKKNSNIDILIGSKKFIEGWNSYRVSNIGLLNIGKKEGSQIIQLFGRGVRLKGYNNSMKRSSFVSRDDAKAHPDNIEIVETLNIFGIKANYMEEFKKHLRQEGISVENHKEFEIPVNIQEDLIDKDLYTLSVNTQKQFIDDYYFDLCLDDEIEIELDLSLNVEIETSLKTYDESQVEEKEVFNLHNYLGLIDINNIYYKLLNYKRERKFFNLHISKEAITNILYSDKILIYYPNKLFRIRSMKDIRWLENITLLALRKYLNSFYLKNKKQWESRYLEYMHLTPELVQSSTYKSQIIKIPQSKADVIKEVEMLLHEEYINWSNVEQGKIGNIYFDRHLFLPLLMENKDVIEANPVLMNIGEGKFVIDLKKFFDESKENKNGLFKSKELFLLRNFSRNKGLGFFEADNFYPDFILWINDIETNTLYINFIDPKGILLLSKQEENPKIQFSTTIKEIEKRVNSKSKMHNISLNSFIVSNTKHKDVIKHYNNKLSINEFNEINVYFQKDQQDYIRKIIEKIIS